MTDLLNVEIVKKEGFVRETLERIGIANESKKIIWPSCYLYKIEEKYYLAHFKQMFRFIRPNSYNNTSEDDIVRRNAIAFCLKNWGLIDVDDSKIDKHGMRLFILPHNKKKEWRIEHKINLSKIPRGMI